MTIFGEAVSPEGMTLDFKRGLLFDEWSSTLDFLASFSECSPFWVGDMLAYGCLQYGESYAQGIPEGISPATIRGYQWVAERVPPANRHPGLSWSHHRAVSALPPAEQSSLLDQAEAEGWSVAETRQHVTDQPTPVKARTYKVALGTVSTAHLALDTPDAEEIAQLLASGKRVTIHT